MKVQIEKNGDELMIRLPDELVRQLGWTEETVVSIESDGRSIIVRTEQDPQRRRRIEQAVKNAHARYGDAFRKLAE